MGFDAFKESDPAQSMFRSLRLEKLLQASETWNELQAQIVAFNSAEGHFVERVRHRDGVASTGERVLLHAICFATDFAWLADELDTTEESGRAWRRMEYSSGEYRAAVAACIARED